MKWKTTSSRPRNNERIILIVDSHHAVIGHCKIDRDDGVKIFVSEDREEIYEWRNIKGWKWCYESELIEGATNEDR